MKKIYIWVSIVCLILGGVVYVFEIINNVKEDKKTTAATTPAAISTVTPTLSSTIMPSDPPEEVYGTFVQIFSETANIRKKPDMNSEIVAEVHEGDRLLLFKDGKGEDGETWYQVAIGSICGYISSKYAKILKLVEDNKK